MSTTMLEVTSQRDMQTLRLRANSMRQHIIRMLEASKSGHPGGSLSASDIMATLWFGGAYRYAADDMRNHEMDRFFISKGHAAPVLYAVFYELGWIDEQDLLSLRQLGSKLQGHPDCHALEALEVCSGSLGQGLSIAAGCALGLKQDDAQVEDPRRVFCLLGDGELQEGSNWEAAMFAAHTQLSNLIAIVDLNNLQIDGYVSDVCSLGDVAAKWRSFGWNVIEVDGHDVCSVQQALAEARAQISSNAPTVLICTTVKGKGVSFMEDKASWHGSAPNPEQAAEALAELAEARARLEEEV